MIDPDLALQLVHDERYISYDTETSGLGPRDFICGYVIANFDTSVYVPVRHGGGANIPDAEGFEAALNKAFAERDRAGYLTIGHNLAFDLKMSHRQKITTNRQLEDTQINEGLINDTAYGFGLDDCCARHKVTAKLGSELYVELADRFGGPADRKQMANYWKLAGDNPKAVEYACGDGISTIELWRAQQRLIEEYDLGRVHQMECALIYYLGILNKRGLKIDGEYGARLVDKDPSKGLLIQAVKEAKEALPPGLNVNSPKELEAMFRASGFNDFNKTPGGKPSFAEAWLETNELGKLVLAVRKYSKAEGSFINPLIDTHNVNGRVHPTLNQSKGDDYGAIGGRLSCSDPNMQAFPKRNKAIGQVVRPLVIPDFGDLYEADFFQQEPHLFAHYSEDENLVRGYNAEPPVDLHDNAMAITGRDRDGAKRLGMGILTGMGYNAMAGHMGWSRAEAKAGVDEYLRAFPRIREFQTNAKNVMLDQGYVRTILGRIAHIAERKFAYKAVSRIIQGSGADHMKWMLLQACRFAESHDDVIQILISIHDSIVFQAHPNHKVIKELVAIIENCQTEPFNFIVPIPIELSRGKNWGEASYGPKIRNPKRGGWLGEWADAA